jgi:hypothetical protein
LRLQRSSSRARYCWELASHSACWQRYCDSCEGCYRMHPVTWCAGLL